MDQHYFGHNTDLALNEGVLPSDTFSSSGESETHFDGETSVEDELLNKCGERGELDEVMLHLHDQCCHRAASVLHDRIRTTLLGPIILSILLGAQHSMDLHEKIAITRQREVTKTFHVKQKLLISTCTASCYRM